jgi:hypothetical protein
VDVVKYGLELNMAVGEWRMANGGWRLANGGWRTANGERRMAAGSENIAYFDLISWVVFTNNTVDMIYYSCHKLNSMR